MCKIAQYLELLKKPHVSKEDFMTTNFLRDGGVGVSMFLHIKWKIYFFN